MKTKYLFLNTTMIFIGTSILEMMLHEVGHFIAGLVLQMDPTLYHNYVRPGIEADDISTQVIFVAAGPLVSLCVGILCHLMLFRRPQVARRLIIWYLSVWGYIGAFGYLLVAPLFPSGDTGYLLRAAQFPMWAIICFAVGGALTLFVLMYFLAAHLVALIPYEVASDFNRRKKFIAAIVLYPLLVGIPILTLLNLPAPQFLSLLAPICSPLSLLYPYYYYLRGKPYLGFSDQGVLIRTYNRSALWIFLLTVVTNRLLVLGLHF